MLQALWSASSGMLGQQTAMDNVANNLANINTNGYKKTKTEFQDLLYSQMRDPGKVTLRGERVPTGFQIGSGVRIASNQVIFEQGSLQQTGNPLDYALEGEAFFVVRQPNGELAYTRNGAFKLDAGGQLVTSDGYPLLDANNRPITFDSPEAVNIDKKGVLFEKQEVERIPGYKFEDAKKLEKVGDYWLPTEESGDPIEAEDAEDIEGPLYFEVILEDGEVAYTNNTNFVLDEEGYLVTEKGDPVEPEIYLETKNGISIDKDGIITTSVEVGRLGIAKFVNPAGLTKTGANLYEVSENSGAATAAGEGDFNLIGATLEGSNVDMAEEMVNMMIANRAYELSSRAIRTSDEMLGMANQLLRR